MAAFTTFKSNNTALAFSYKPPLVILASCVITMYKSKGNWQPWQKCLGSNFTMETVKVMHLNREELKDRIKKFAE